MVKYRTKMFRKEDLQRKWYLFDAKDVTLGRLATKISILLQGKDKAIYTPHLDGGDHVVVINSKHIFLSGNKKNNKVYYSHSLYPGGLKEVTAKTLLKKFPNRLLEKAVKNMLPKNRLRDLRMQRLHIFETEIHHHHAQKPLKLN